MNIAKNADEIIKNSGVDKERAQQIREHFEKLPLTRRIKAFEIAKNNKDGDPKERQLIGELLGEKVAFEAPKAAASK